MDLKNNNELRQFFFSDEDYTRFCERYKADKRVKKCVENVRAYERRGLYLQAMQERKKLEQITKEMVQSYIDANKDRKEQIDLCKLALSDEDREMLATDAVAICMCCDIVESFCMDIGEMLKRYGNYELVQFLGINKLLKEAREHLRWVQSDTDLRKYDSWGKACDFYIDSIPKRAKKLMKASDARKQRNKKTE